MDQLEKQLFDKYVTKPLELEEEIATTARNVAASLAVRSDGVTFEFPSSGPQRAEFVVKQRTNWYDVGGSKTISLAISNEATRSRAGNKYIPYTISVEVNNNFTLRENYEAIIEAFLRHLVGEDRPEVIDD